MKTYFLLAISFCLSLSLVAQKSKKQTKTSSEDTPKELQSSTYSALSFRSVGPAVTSGRIADFAVHPQNSATYYIATAAGGVWKTINHGTTYTPIFDSQDSYSIGCVVLDPQQPSTVWVGTGENNNQRSVSYGDGVYKSMDAGKSWKNMGLKQSEHIANIIVQPDNSQVIWVAAYGPVWSDGGDRGVYKSTDGGENWKLVKEVSQYTGCNNLIMDPRNPNVLYAAFHQRQRKGFTYIGGGSETAIFKTIDGGETWQQLAGGLPSGDLGRIGISISPVDPDVIFAAVEAGDKKGGIYRSKDGGASWNKQSGHYSSGNYYQELTCDPKDVDRIFLTNTYFQVSDDAGKNMRNLGEINKHIDNHCIWIDPDFTDHLLVGCDGGVYETWDFAATWHYKANLPVTQFYKVSTDNATPFYHIHGGTQDNLSLGGPSRTTSMNGIVNSDWYITSQGDGFETQIDPVNPDIIYAQAQYGELTRFDRKSGEYYSIKPLEGEGEAALRWNWDSPLLLSNHSPTRLYYGANIVFRSDDRGNKWKAISPDLSRQVDRNTFKVMGKVWSVDAVAKNRSTDIYGQTTSIAESPFDENIIWVGTDDGLIQVTTDGGSNWRKVDGIPGAPEMSYVHQIIASVHDKNTAYVAFNHHRYGDFKPYIFKTTDAGHTWIAIHSDLPKRGSVYTIAEDHIKADLLFCGTEFGTFFTPNGGDNWVQLKAGLPTIAVRDMELQRRESDIVLGTFGRGFYVLDDYSPLRDINAQQLEQEAHVFPIKDALMYIERTYIGLRDKGHLGSSYFTTPNPKVGAVFTYYLKDDIKTLKEIRQEKEADQEDDFYPSLDDLRAEAQQADPFILFTIKNSSGEVVRHLKASAKAGIKRIVWDFRHATPAPIANRYHPKPDVLFGSAELGHLAMPGSYTVTMSKYVDGLLTPITDAIPFEAKMLEQSTLPTDHKIYDTFVRKVADIRRAFSAANHIRNNMDKRIRNIESAVIDMPDSPETLLRKTHNIQQQLTELGIKMDGDATLSRHQFETPPSIGGRIGRCEYGMWNVTAIPNHTFTEAYRIAAKEFGPALQILKALDQEIQILEQQLEVKNAPYTAGRWPIWNK